MGKVSAEKLRAADHTIMGIDLKGGEITADLSTDEGRQQAIAATLEASGGHLDGAVFVELDDPKLAPAIKSFPVPTGGFGTSDGIAEWVMLMLSPAADFLCGSVIFVDGGTDGYFRSDDWPRAVPLSGLRRYMRLSNEFASRA